MGWILFLFCFRILITAEEALEDSSARTGGPNLGGLTRIYSSIVSDYDGDNCSFSPPCSVFFQEAVRSRGLLKGTLMFSDRFQRDANFFKKGLYPVDSAFHYIDPVEGPVSANKSKIPLKAAILSAIIPGAGKFYSGRFLDGISSLLINSLTAYLAYDNFKAGHRFGGASFSILSLFFYSGNIYGSALSCGGTR